MAYARKLEPVPTKLKTRTAAGKRVLGPSDGEEEDDAAVEQEIKGDVKVSAEIGRAEAAGDRTVQPVGHTVEQYEDERGQRHPECQGGKGAGPDTEIRPA